LAYKPGSCRPDRRADNKPLCYAHPLGNSTASEMRDGHTRNKQRDTASLNETESAFDNPHSGDLLTRSLKQANT
jgi:hypothetical protein